MKTKGTIQLGLKVSPELRDAVRKYEVNVMAVCRRALFAAIVRKAGRKALGIVDAPKKTCRKCHRQYQTDRAGRAKHKAECSQYSRRYGW